MNEVLWTPGCVPLNVSGRQRVSKDVIVVTHSVQALRTLFRGFDPTQIGPTVPFTFRQTSKINFNFEEIHPTNFTLSTTQSLSHPISHRSPPSPHPATSDVSCIHTAQRTYRMFVGIVSQGGRYALLVRCTGATRDAGGKVAYDAEEGT